MLSLAMQDEAASVRSAAATSVGPSPAFAAFEASLAGRPESRSTGGRSDYAGIPATSEDVDTAIWDIFARLGVSVEVAGEEKSAMRGGQGAAAAVRLPVIEESAGLDDIFALGIGLSSDFAAKATEDSSAFDTSADMADGDVEHLGVAMLASGLASAPRIAGPGAGSSRGVGATPQSQASDLSLSSVSN